MKDKVKINDNRLTPTMDRVRSGRTQMFRERNPDDRTFINSDNCDLELEHEDKAMYAQLIDGEWYWVSGCSECKGDERGRSYIECEKHDVCKCCGVSRKEIKGSVWGGSKGWTCNSCKEEKDSQVRREAFEKLDGEEPDCMWTDKIICPHCGSTICNGDIHEGQDLKCYVCEGELSLEVEHAASYSTKIKGKRITK